MLQSPGAAGCVEALQERFRLFGRGRDEVGIPFLHGLDGVGPGRSIAELDEAAATVSVAFDGSKLTLAGVVEGTATITVTAQDTDRNVVCDTFEVSVVGPPSPVANLNCVAETGRVTFLRDVPQWSGGEAYAYDYRLTLPDGVEVEVRVDEQAGPAQAGEARPQGFNLLNEFGGGFHSSFLTGMKPRRTIRP